jgi:hypothetical protein
VRKQSLFVDQTRSQRLQKKLMKTILICIKLDTKLDHLEIKQDLVRYEREKPRPTVENDTGSWTLFGGTITGSP